MFKYKSDSDINRFKTGDKVRCIDGSLDRNKVYIVRSIVRGYDDDCHVWINEESRHCWYISCFELIE